MMKSLRVAGLVVGLVVLGPVVISDASPTVGCGVDSPCVTTWQEGTTVVFEWDGYQDWDHYNVRIGREGKDWPQVEVGGGSHGRHTLENVRSATHYWVNVQGCDRDFFGSSDCGPWSEGNGISSITTAGRDDCKHPFVWRLARPSDRVCVSTERQRLTAEQNGLAAQRRSPNGGAYGVNTCKQGFVWREAFDGDVVCVLPVTRERAWQDNAAAASRRVYG